MCFGDLETGDGGGVALSLVLERWLSVLDAVLGRPILKRSNSAAIGEVAQPNIRAVELCTAKVYARSIHQSWPAGD